MADLVELTHEAHGDLKLDTLAALKIAKNTHILSLRVTEVSRAACELPVFLTKSNDESPWLISAITSLEVEKNLLARDDKWNSIFQPSSMSTYPFFLMRHPSQENQYTIGIDPENSAFSKEEGEPIFEAEKKAGPRLSQVTKILQADMRNDALTFQFTKHIDELGLIKPIDVSVGYAGNKVNKLKGLNTIDEARLGELSEEQFKELREKNYLAPIYSLMISLYQVNNLIRLHNLHSDSEKIVQASIDPLKDEEEAKTS